MRTHISADDHFFRPGKNNISSADGISNIGIDIRRVNAADIIGLENT